MGNFIINSLLWTFALYGLFELIKQIIYMCTYTNLKEDGIYVIIAVKNQEEKIEGFLSFKIHHYLHHDRDTGEIVELIVLPEKRNLKIGKQLVEKIEEIAKEKQLEQIELSTSTYRKDAHRFYERQGYEKLHYNYTKALDD